MADKYLIGTGNWVSDTIWSTTSGGSNDTTHPVAGDAVFLDQASGAVTLTVSTSSACLSLDCTGGTGYAGSLVMNQNLTVSGNVTLDSAMTISADVTTRALILNDSATLTSAGKVWPCVLQLGGTSKTYTLADDWSLSGALYVSSSTTCNDFSITAAGLTILSTLGGTTTVTLTGGTWSGAGSMNVALTLDGDVTVSGTVKTQIGSITYSSGTITTTGSTLEVIGVATLDTAGVTWNLVKLLASSATFTLNSLFSAATIEFGNYSMTLGGTAGFTCATLQNVAITVARTLTLTQTNTYTVTSALNIAGNATYSLTLQSSHATDHVPFDFTGASSPNLNYVNATRINSNGGLKIYTTGAVVTSDNWEHVDAAGATPNTMRNVYNQAIHRASIW